MIITQGRAHFSLASFAVRVVPPSRPRTPPFSKHKIITAASEWGRRGSGTTEARSCPGRSHRGELVCDVPGLPSLFHRGSPYPQPRPTPSPPRRPPPCSYLRCSPPPHPPAAPTPTATTTQRPAWPRRRSPSCSACIRSVDGWSARRKQASVSERRDDKKQENNERRGSELG